MGAVEPFPLIADLDGTPRGKEPVSAEFDGFLVEAEGCAFRGARGGLARGRGICPDHITLDGGERENRSVVVVIVMAIFRRQLDVLEGLADRRPIHGQRLLVATQP